MKRRGGSTLLLGLSCFASACAAPRSPRVVHNPDPSGKIPAIKRAAETKDMAAARQMIKDLESDDPAVRFYAIEGLERLTGETFGYRYFDDDAQRKPALEKWQAWLHGFETGTTVGGE